MDSFRTCRCKLSRAQLGALFLLVGLVAFVCSALVSAVLLSHSLERIQVETQEFSTQGAVPEYQQPERKSKG